MITKRKKLCGVLCEPIHTGKDHVSFSRSPHTVVVMGVGININSLSFHQDIATKTTSLRHITKKKFNLAKVLYQTLRNIKFLLDDLSIPLKEEIRLEMISASSSIGERIGYYDKNNIARTGIAVDINNRGSIMIQDEHTNSLYEVNEI